MDTKMVKSFALVLMEMAEQNDIMSRALLQIFESHDGRVVVDGIDTPVNELAWVSLPPEMRP